MYIIEGKEKEAMRIAVRIKRLLIEQKLVEKQRKMYRKAVNKLADLYKKLTEDTKLFNYEDIEMVELQFQMDKYIAEDQYFAENVYNINKILKEQERQVLQVTGLNWEEQREDIDIISKFMEIILP